MASLPASEEAYVLELLAESTRGKSELAEFRQQVLNRRSHLPAENVENKFNLPKELPQNSHGAHAVSLGAGYDQNGSGWAQLRYRFVLHNLMDPSEGYIRETTLEVGDLRLRYGSENQFANSSATLVNALVLKPWTEDQPHLTWHVHSEVLDFLKAARWQNSGGAGITTRLGSADFYLMAIADSYLDGSELGSFGVFAGASAGLYLNLFERFKLRGNLDHLWPIHSIHQDDFWQGELQAAYSRSTKYSLQLDLVSSRSSQSVLLEALRYF
jgi:hypothetical protein